MAAASVIKARLRRRFRTTVGIVALLALASCGTAPSAPDTASAPAAAGASNPARDPITSRTQVTPDKDQTTIRHGLTVRRLTFSGGGTPVLFEFFWNPVKHATAYRFTVTGFSGRRSRTLTQFIASGKSTDFGIGVGGMPYRGRGPFRAKVVALSHGTPIGRPGWLIQPTTLKTSASY